MRHIWHEQQMIREVGNARFTCRNTLDWSLGCFHSISPGLRVLLFFCQYSHLFQSNFGKYTGLFCVIQLFLWTHTVVSKLSKIAWASQAVTQLQLLFCSCKNPNNVFKTHCSLWFPQGLCCRCLLCFTRHIISHYELCQKKRKSSHCLLENPALRSHTSVEDVNG